MKDYETKGTNRKMDLVQNVSSLNDKQQLQGVKNQGTKVEKSSRKRMFQRCR